MPQGGSFTNIPDTPIGGDELVLLKGISSLKGGVSDWNCSKVIGTGSSASFTYVFSAGAASTLFTVGVAGDSIDMAIVPGRVTAVNNVMFMCNQCDGCGPMTGTTAYYDTGYGWITSGATTSGAMRNPNTAFAPTIIGGNGLNN
jgi:hypothetical protein|tara:strand:+ start:1351 stop:1782 length:432 start_codon:yes stop_codon:yes gene_type:complete